MSNPTVYLGFALVITNPPLYRGIALVMAVPPLYRAFALVMAVPPLYRRLCAGNCLCARFSRFQCFRVFSVFSVFSGLCAYGLVMGFAPVFVRQSFELSILHQTQVCKIALFLNQFS
jgi:hypothetical protein